jgi:hypothetical protein
MPAPREACWWFGMNELVMNELVMNELVMN